MGKIPSLLLLIFFFACSKDHIDYTGGKGDGKCTYVDPTTGKRCNTFAPYYGNRCWEHRNH